MKLRLRYSVHAAPLPLYDSKVILNSPTFVDTSRCYCKVDQILRAGESCDKQHMWETFHLHIMYISKAISSLARQEGDQAGIGADFVSKER